MSHYQPINTAILSYGMSGEIFHGPLLTAHPGFKLSTIQERSKNKAQSRYPEAIIVRTLDEILENSQIELVVVNTPHDSHFELTTKVLESGKHAIVEKPFVTAYDEGRQLIELADRRGKMLSVFQNRRWDGDFRTVQKVIESNVLGDLVEFEAHYDRYRPAVDHTTWKESAEPGAGILYNLGSHMIDQALTLFGMPKSVSAVAGIQRRGGQSDDFYDIRMKYPSLSVILKSSYLVREHGPRYVLHGVHGSFIKYGLDPQEQALKEGGTPGSPGWGIEPAADWGKLNAQIGPLHYDGRIETFSGNYLGFYDSIYSAIRQGKPPAVSAQQALDVIKIIETVKESSERGKTIPL